MPDGFATTAEAYRRFLAHGGLADRINAMLADLDVDDVRRLAEVGKDIRDAVEAQAFPADLEEDIRAAYQELVGNAGEEVSWAVRSSATAEDLPDASFAGQQETFLNIRGIDNILHAIKLVFASLYNGRAIAYRVHSNFDHSLVALSAGVQRMVPSDIRASGVMFTIDTEEDEMAGKAEGSVARIDPLWTAADVSRFLGVPIGRSTAGGPLAPDQKPSGWVGTCARTRNRYAAGWLNRRPSSWRALSDERENHRGRARRHPVCRAVA